MTSRPTRIPILDVGVGLLCRAARLGVFGPRWPYSAVIGNLNVWWWDVREDGRDEASRTLGRSAIWTAMTLCELEDFEPQAGAEVALVAEGDRLLPPYSVNATFCRAALTPLFDLPS